jgi:hypothetical protein
MLLNSVVPQPAQEVNIYASGGAILPSTRMSGDVGKAAPLFIADLSLLQTSACESSGCTVGTVCSCSGTFSNVPIGRQVYVLRAEIQCNGGGSGKYNITAPIMESIQASILQPPKWCQGRCDDHFTILPPVDVTQQMASSSLAYGASIDAAGQDLCMAGQHLKAWFVLQYTAA